MPNRLLSMCFIFSICLERRKFCLFVRFFSETELIPVYCRILPQCFMDTDWHGNLYSLSIKLTEIE